MVIGFGIAGGCAAVSAAAAGARVLVLETRRGRRAAPPRWPAATSISAAAPPCSRRPATPTAPRRCTRTSSRCRANPNTTRSAPTARAASSTSTGSRTSASQFERSYYPDKAVIQPDTEGLIVHRQREGLALQGASPCPPRAATRSRCRATPGRRRHGDRPAAQAGRRTRRADPLRDRRDQPGASTTARWSGWRWKHFGETGAIGPGGGDRRRRVRDEPRHGGRAHTRRNSHEKPRLVRPTCWATPTTTASASGWASPPAAPPSTWTSRSSPPPAYPPEILLTGIIVNNLGQRFVAEDSYHSRTSAFVMDQPDSAAYLIVDEAHIADAGDAADQVHRRLGDGRGDGVRAGHPGGQPGRNAEPLQRVRRQGRGPRLPQAARIPCAAQDTRPVGGLRPVTGQGHVLRLHHGRTGHRASTARCCARTAA